MRVLKFIVKQLLVLCFICLPLNALAAKVVEPMDPASIKERLVPFGEVNIVGGPVVSDEPVVVKLDAKGIYNKYCTTCHAVGIAGAPKLGDKKAWAARIAQGLPILHKHAIKGLRAMPAMGTCAECSEDDIKMTVDWMVNQSN